ncbi:Hypothetical protein CINCED_3A002747 [Cinara cedri]|uniref:Uncharacterized protein n=1 Tax=Cinara cedri TaxID=506608 RepID=A0A5E4NIK3_9HEMI|nr:Hypothetical protein CINCED_3A002747 [Cinara cedri]
MSSNEGLFNDKFIVFDFEEVDDELLDYLNANSDLGEENDYQAENSSPRASGSNAPRPLEPIGITLDKINFYSTILQHPERSFEVVTNTPPAPVAERPSAENENVKNLFRMLNKEHKVHVRSFIDLAEPQTVYLNDMHPLSPVNNPSNFENQMQNISTMDSRHYLQPHRGRRVPKSPRGRPVTRTPAVKRRRSSRQMASRKRLATNKNAVTNNYSTQQDDTVSNEDQLSIRFSYLLRKIYEK